MLQLPNIYCTPNSSSSTLNGKHFNSPNMHPIFCVQRRTATTMLPSSETKLVVAAARISPSTELLVDLRHSNDLAARTGRHGTAVGSSRSFLELAPTHNHVLYIHFRFSKCMFHAASLNWNRADRQLQPAVQCSGGDTPFHPK